MEAITVRDLLTAVGGTLIGPETSLDRTVSSVDTDSRDIHPGSLFLPLVGERFDGHTYIGSALEAGAAGCLTAREPEHYQEGRFYIKVEDTQRALRDLAFWYKEQFRIPFVGVTGSVGKTTAKDMIASVLSVKYKVLKTEGNFNNNVGLPLTLLRLDRSVQIGVVEMGMDRFGEIDYLGDIVRPEVGVITNIGDAHIERLGSRENIFRAKCELLPHIRKENGLLILNGDDALLSTLRGRTPVPAVFCGSGEGLEYRAQSASSEGLDSLRSRLTTPAMDREVCIPALGSHMIYPTLIAAAVGEHFGLTADEIEQGIARFVPTRMRMNLVQRGNGITILDDTYNANPQSMRAAISVLADSRSAWKLALLARPPHRSGGVPGQAEDRLPGCGGRSGPLPGGGGTVCRHDRRLSLRGQEGRPGDPPRADPAGQHHPGQGIPGDADGGAGGPASGADAGAIRKNCRPFSQGGAHQSNQRGRYDRHICLQPGERV